jgi:hypothetical protein
VPQAIDNVSLTLRAASPARSFAVLLVIFVGHGFSRDINSAEYAPLPLDGFLVEPFVLCRVPHPFGFEGMTLLIPSGHDFSS